MLHEEKYTALRPFSIEIKKKLSYFHSVAILGDLLLPLLYVMSHGYLKNLYLLMQHSMDIHIIKCTFTWKHQHQLFPIEKSICGES